MCIVEDVKIKKKLESKAVVPCFFGGLRAHPFRALFATPYKFCKTPREYRLPSYNI